MVSFPDQITDELDALVQRVQRSLVTVQNGGRGVGAGVIWRHNGVILTNNHVVQRRRPQVGLPDGHTFSAELIDQDPEVDLALLKVDAQDLPTALVADSRSLRIGELVIAVGHPWGQRGVVTAGVISALGRAVTRGPRETVPIIRSDVLLAPGNSGGPLVNANGAVVGINAMIVGGDQGVAIPSELAGVFVTEALDRKVVLGVSVQPTPLPAFAYSAQGQTQKAGLLVIDLTPGGPAARAGLIPGDILVELGGTPLKGTRALLRALTDRTAGERVPVRILRAGQWQEVEAELAPLERVM